MARLVFISEKNRERYKRVLSPVGDLLAGTGIHPNVLSIAGLVLSAAAGIVYSTGSFFWAAWVVVLAGICDTLDGEIARRASKGSRFGAFFDSTLDRYSDTLILMGLAYHFAGGSAAFSIGARDTNTPASPGTVVVIILAMIGSFMVSYARARAEGMGVECKKGLMQRPERMILLIIGSLLGAIPVVGLILMKLALLVLAVAANLTAIQRIVHVRNQLSEEHPVP